MHYPAQQVVVHRNVDLSMNVPDFDRRYCASLQSVAECSDAFARWMQAAALPRSLAEPLSLALEELLVNIVAHGCAQDERCTFSVAAVCSAEGVVLTLRDDGAGFDPTRARAPDIHAPLAQREPGGLGLWLVHHLVDKLTYRRVGDENELTLNKRYTAGGSAAASDATG